MVAMAPFLDLSQTSAILTKDSEKDAKLKKEVIKEVVDELTYEQKEKKMRDKGDPMAHVRHFFRGASDSKTYNNIL